MEQLNLLAVIGATLDRLSTDFVDTDIDFESEIKSEDVEVRENAIKAHWYRKAKLAYHALYLSFNDLMGEDETYKSFELLIHYFKMLGDFTASDLMMVIRRMYVESRGNQFIMR